MLYLIMGVITIQWKDACDEVLMITSTGTGNRGLYYISMATTQYCVKMDIPEGGIAFIGNGVTLDEAKSVAQEFDISNVPLTE